MNKRTHVRAYLLGSGLAWVWVGGWQNVFDKFSSGPKPQKEEFKMSDEAKTVTIEVAEWRRLRRIEDAAVWCIGYLYWKTSAESRDVRRLEKSNQSTNHRPQAR